MSQDEEPIAALGEDESWQLLAVITLGRLVTCVAAHPRSPCKNYVTHRPSLLFRTAESTKLLSAVMNDRVAFEVDEHNVEEAGSVIVEGRGPCAVQQRRNRKGRLRSASGLDPDNQTALRANHRHRNHRPQISIRDRARLRGHHHLTAETILRTTT